MGGEVGEKEVRRLGEVLDIVEGVRGDDLRENGRLGQCVGQVRTTGRNPWRPGLFGHFGKV